MRKLMTLGAAGVLAFSTLIMPGTAQAAAKVYKNCAELRKTYPYGVAAKGAKDKVNTNLYYGSLRHTINTAVYTANKALDTDKDKIACELPRPRACATLNITYKHGVGRAGAKDKVTGTTKSVTNFTVYTALYNTNTHLDRDKDGISCEK